MNATPTVLTGSFLKLCRCFVKVWRCAWCLAVILRLIFVTFSLSELASFGFKAFRHWLSCELNSSNRFCHIFLKLCMCFRQCLKMCMTIGCNPRLHWEYLAVRTTWFLGFKHLDTGYLVNATPPTVLAWSFYTLHVFWWLMSEVCITFDCNPQINFCHCKWSSKLVIVGLKAFRHWVTCVYMLC